MLAYRYEYGEEGVNKTVFYADDSHNNSMLNDPGCRGNKIPQAEALLPWKLMGVLPQSLPDP